MLLEMIQTLVLMRLTKILPPKKRYDPKVLNLATLKTREQKQFVANLFLKS